jgi:hypothetical protein
MKPLPEAFLDLDRVQELDGVRGRESPYRTPRINRTIYRSAPILVVIY